MRTHTNRHTLTQPNLTHPEPFRGSMELFQGDPAGSSTCGRKGLVDCSLAASSAERDQRRRRQREGLIVCRWSGAPRSECGISQPRAPSACAGVRNGFCGCALAEHLQERRRRQKRRNADPGDRGSQHLVAGGGGGRWGRERGGGSPKQRDILFPGTQHRSKLEQPGNSAHTQRR